MDRGFDMAHGALESSAAQLMAHGEDYAAALSRLRERGAGAAAWGDDGLMSSLASGYTRGVQAALGAYQHVGDVIGAAGAGLATASRRVTHAEEFNYQLAEDLERDLFDGGPRSSMEGRPAAEELARRQLDAPEQSNHQLAEDVAQPNYQLAEEIAQHRLFDTESSMDGRPAVGGN